MQLESAFYLLYPIIMTFLCCIGGYLLFSKRSAFVDNKASISRLRKSAGALILLIAFTYISYLALVLILCPDGDMNSDAFKKVNLINYLFNPTLVSPAALFFLETLSMGKRSWKHFLRFAYIPIALVIAYIFTLKPILTYIVVAYWFVIWLIEFPYHCTKQYKYYKALVNNYADTNKKDIRWVLFLPIILTPALALYFCNGFLNEWLVAYVNDALTILFSAYIAHHVDRQEPIKKEFLEEETSVKIEISEATSQAFENVAVALRKECEGKKMFLEPDLTREILAKRIHINRTYITSYLISIGLTYNSYINSLRVEYAAELIKNSQESPKLKDIAIKSGFKTYPTFNNAFKDIKGMKPSEFADKNR